MALEADGTLEKYGVELLGASAVAIETAENRALFRAAMAEVGLATARGIDVRSLDEASEAAAVLGFPIMVRASFTLGGGGAGVAFNRHELIERVEAALEASPTRQVLLEESVLGWKEFELEVVRDRHDNAIIVCSIENVDPMGVHTGDSITVAPALTLTDREYQAMRRAAITVLRRIGVDTGGSNVQFALNPRDGRMLVVEMNPRVSRSSALASKATGFPIARVAAKLALGYTLDELRNEITGGVIPSSFEPTIDYVVTKIPRFAFEKFPGSPDRLGAQMKSVGEVMALGRTFQESLHKAMRGLEMGTCGFDLAADAMLEDREQLSHELITPGPRRLWYVGEALRRGWSREEVAQLSGIDPWFVAEIGDLIVEEQALGGKHLHEVSPGTWRRLKRKGFADARLAALMGADEEQVRSARQACGVHPVFHRVDSCAGEFPATTAYLYGTYETHCEARPTDRPKVVILGSGPNRIGQGIEFDTCCVEAATALRGAGFETIMINCNPETVSTDYDCADRLYFEPLTLEDVLAVLHVEQPLGVIVQYGGQTPLRLAHGLAACGVPILGTPVEAIDLAEDRERFGAIIAELGLHQPRGLIARSVHEAAEVACELGFPVLVRPSYVLGGRAMRVVHDAEDLEGVLAEAAAAAPGQNVLLDRLLEQAVEVDVDAICDAQGAVFVAGIMEHIEQAGVHSGDSACVLPPHGLSAALCQEMEEQVHRLARRLGVVGLMNVQFAIQDGVVYVLEVNPRAARTVPFVARATGIPVARCGALCMVGRTLAAQGLTGKRPTPPYYAVKEAVFPFARFEGVDPVLGPEMKSTGEVMGFGHDMAQAFAKAQEAVGVRLPRQGAVLISVRDQDKPAACRLAAELAALGYALLATRGTATAIEAAGFACGVVNKVHEGRPHVIDLLQNGAIDLIMNTTESKRTMAEAVSIRAAALRYGVGYFTTMTGAEAACRALASRQPAPLQSLQAWHRLAEDVYGGHRG
jgi:carbamoyl-phosphate synthase large subunit